MASVTGLCNYALRKVGGTRITDITDGSVNAEKCNDIYDDLRDDMLRDHNWRFATKLVKLARIATAPAFAYDYAYALPADWLRTISAHDNDAGYGVVDFQEMEVNGKGVLASSVENLYLVYVYRVTDVNRMSADFRGALRLALARDLAVPVANSNRLHETLAIEAKSKMQRAKGTTALGSPPTQRSRGSWANSRSASWPSARWPR